MAWPISFLVGLGWLWRRHPEWNAESWPFYLFAVLFAAAFGNVIAVPLIALRRTRGFRGGLFE